MLFLAMLLLGAVIGFVGAGGAGYCHAGEDIALSVKGALECDLFAVADGLPAVDGVCYENIFVLEEDDPVCLEALVYIISKIFELIGP